MTETIVNAYPSYSATITLEFANCGTVPVKCSAFIIDAGPDSGFIEITNWVIRNDDGTTYDTGSGLTALAGALYAYQIDPCNRVQVDITKHVLQNHSDTDELLPENATIVITETVTWTQWNMVN